MASATTDSTRERIIDAAEECFARYGIAKTTVEDIAAAAGLSRATVYRSVTGGRDELILAVMLRELTRVLDRLAALLRRSGPVPEAVIEGIMDVVSHVRSQPHFAHFLVPEAAGHTQAVVAGAAERILDMCCEYVRPYFEAAQREGQIREGIEVEGTVEFLFRIITSLIVLDRGRDPEATRNFLRSYVVPVIVGP
ncbi:MULTISPECIES: TetR/AcrR family transcriptional regulator [Thermomonospora]|uniref:Transcriptional regulator, TetR family n=1 Tax=Thermomonospora curvata (strain ATCC 19995 / DSM 43183 / JCM 3096 / KCTC 9072 / NBRC 15933 / NCIMB 10081 / Henssen B9) TaxID=471852 RepID=D1AE08_THECD|nr:MULTISPECIES: TetR/AcrR family transcriptional regulator [Thermomonospora]ACY99434.1 transcriptional regulator, TetR family [Thermomonospora curvata DSM 43183]PKK12479.1 MAG: TetR/AcrR family transcriptional regulator [Thermomonospora sp. CIF 1]